MAAHLRATLLTGPAELDEVEVKVHSGDADRAPIGCVRVGGLTIQTNPQDGPEDLAQWFDAVATMLRDAADQYDAEHDGSDSDV